MCRFEKVSPQGDDFTRKVAVRVVKIVNPVKRVYRHEGRGRPSKENAIPDMPVEGELMPSSRPGKPWVYNVNKKCRVARGLTALFENEPQPSESP